MSSTLPTKKKLKIENLEIFRVPQLIFVIVKYQKSVHVRSIFRLQVQRPLNDEHFDWNEVKRDPRERQLCWFHDEQDDEIIQRPTEERYRFRKHQLSH